jgi:replicative DNA helicase
MSALDGATFALDAPEQVESIWGDGSRSLWAKGEPLMIVKPDGVGGTTIAQQLILARAGIKVPTLLGLPVASDLDRRVLYLALDRPQQAARSMRRMVTEDDRLALEAGLTVWKGELPFDIVNQPDRLLAFVQEHDAGTVVFDSLKTWHRTSARRKPGRRSTARCSYAWWQASRCWRCTISARGRPRTRSPRSWPTYTARAG